MARPGHAAFYRFKCPRDSGGGGHNPPGADRPARCRPNRRRPLRGADHPHFYIIDPKGVLRYQGAFDDVTFRQRVSRQAYLEKALEAVLAGGRPDPDQTPPYGCTLVRYAA
jgi:hypothetical protein